MYYLTFVLNFAFFWTCSLRELVKFKKTMEIKIKYSLTSSSCEQFQVSVDCNSAIVLIKLKINLNENMFDCVLI